jgi:phosphoglycolate phosphatase-like HAD superfamily hydrolase
VLLLFDIEGTLLLEATHAHHEALLAAIRQVWHLADPDPSHVETEGRTDTEIARQILLRHGVDADDIDDGLHEFRAVAAAIYARNVPRDLADHVAPGVTEELPELAERHGTLLSLATGELEPIARLKLRAAGIGHFFALGQGAFGSDAEDRAELPMIARVRAGARDGGGPWPRRRTVLIGDTPLDIACARADGVRSIAVATGPYSAAELRDADHVVADFRELLHVIAGLHPPPRAPPGR